jgi:hypothetical protein
MGKLWGRVGSTLLLLVCGPLSQMSWAWGHTQAPAMMAAGHLTESDAKALEEGLKTNPDNLDSREKLISFYFMEMVTSRKSELEEKREQHIFWLIAHHPESQLAGSPEAEIIPMGPLNSTEAYQRGKRLWLQEVEKSANDKRILRNAARFLALMDGATSRDLLEKASAIDPSDPETASSLAQSYEQERILARSSEERATLARKAMSVRERGLENADGEDRFYALGSLAMSAFEAGDTVKAQSYASELLQLAKKFRQNWNYGNALYDGNITLGRVDLERGNIDGAKEHLLAAGQTPGSPQLDSFGPNMTLAKALLDKDERDIVLTFLQSCQKFWKMGGDKLTAWIATIRGGGMPDFGVNLRY